MTVDTAALPPRPSTASPPWASPKAAALAAPSAGVPSLQALLCHWLAKNLHVIEALDDLPPHLADLVRTEIRADRSLLRDDAVAVWLEAIDFDARHLSLRWASNLTDAGLFTIAAHTQLTQGLVSLDLGYCESVGDAGMQQLCPSLASLRRLTLAGCRGCGDATVLSVAAHLRGLTALNLEVLSAVTDRSVQAVARNLLALEELLLGGCALLTCVSTSLIADHGRGRLRKLGLGGLANLSDVDLEDIGRLSRLEWLELRACPRVSDAGIKQIGLLVGRQCKAHDAWLQEAEASPAAAAASPPPPTLTHLDLGGLGRLSDTALLKLLQRARHLRSLDLRGCDRLSADGVAAALAATTADGVQTAPALFCPRLEALTLTRCAGATDAVVARIREARPALALTT